MLEREIGQKMKWFSMKGQCRLPTVVSKVFNQATSLCCIRDISLYTRETVCLHTIDNCKEEGGNRKAKEGS